MCTVVTRWAEGAPVQVLAIRDAGYHDDGVGNCSLITRTIAAGASIDAVVSPFSGTFSYDLVVTSSGGSLDVVAD